MTNRRGLEFVDELARDPDLVRRLLATHVEETKGDGRCAGCCVDASIRPHWPCGPQAHARQAQDRIDANRPRPVR